MWIIKCSLNCKELLSSCIINALTVLKVAVMGCRGFSEAPEGSQFY